MPDPLGRACKFLGDPRPCVTAVDIAIVRPGRSSVDHAWLMWGINAPPTRAAISAFQSGTTRKRISRSNLAKVKLPIPPLSEQRRIVAEIEKHFTRLDAAVASLQRARANLKRYRASVLKAACEGRLVPTEAELARREGRSYEPAWVLLERILKEGRTHWEAQDGRRGKYQEPQLPDASGLPPVPEGWVWTSLGQVSEIQGGIQKHPKRAPRENTYPFLRVANVLRGQLDLNEVHRIELFPGELEKLCLQTGDLLIVEGNGSPREIGRMAIWKGEIVASSTSGLYTLSVSKVARLPIPLPPSAEQQRIVAEVERHMSLIQAAENVVEANLKRAEPLRQAILRRAFEGKLVPQDPTDEPASVLLDRIRKERQQREKAGDGARRRSSLRRTAQETLL